MRRKQTIADVYYPIGGKDEKREADSGSTENAANMVIGVWRPNRGKKDDFLALSILKNTKGPETTGIVCNFDLNTLRITERVNVENWIDR